MAALVALRAREPEDKHALNRSRWRLAGLLGHEVRAGNEAGGVPVVLLELGRNDLRVFEKVLVANRV